MKMAPRSIQGDRLQGMALLSRCGFVGGSVSLGVGSEVSDTQSQAQCLIHSENPDVGFLAPMSACGPVCFSP